MNLQADGYLDNRWHFVTVTLDGSSNGTLYVDGNPVTTDTYSGLRTSTNVLRIGTDASTFATYNWNGYIDDVKLYNYVRSQAQISYDFNRGAPAGWWKFDECQGSTAYDATGNGNSGTITIGTGAGTGHIDSVGTCSTSGTAWYNGVTGKFNSSISYDGIDDNTQIADSSVLDFEQIRTLLSPHG